MAFQLFKKKNKEQAPDPTREQVQAFAAGFLPEEFTLVAVTAPGGPVQRKGEEDPLYTVELPLTAWMDEDDAIVQRQDATLTALADERLRGYLFNRLNGNAIIKVQVRPGRDGDKFQLVGMPEPGMDPELKAILDEQVKPVCEEVEGVGTFTLSRTAGWFQTEIDRESPILLTFDAQGERERMVAAVTAAAGELETRDEAAKHFAAGELLAQINAEDQEPVNRQELAQSLQLDSLHVEEDATVQLWYTSEFACGGIYVILDEQGQPTRAGIEETE